MRDLNWKTKKYTTLGLIQKNKNGMTLTWNIFNRNAKLSAVMSRQEQKLKTTITQLNYDAIVSFKLSYMIKKKMHLCVRLRHVDHTF